MKPIALDLCCGKGGWGAGLIAEGWHVIGVDLDDFSKYYPGEFIQADLLTWEGWRTIPGILLVVCSPPCDQFSRWGMPWTRARNPPIPDMALVNRCRYIGKELGVPCVLENVQAAQRFLGRSQANCGPFHLWGDVPAIVPVFQGKKKESYGGKQKADRAVIPANLARWIGRSFNGPPAK